MPSLQIPPVCAFAYGYEQWRSGQQAGGVLSRNDSAASPCARTLKTIVDVRPSRMARPRKEGLEYFSLDCILDGKVEMLEVAHGNDGFAVLVKLWQEIYQTPDGRLDISVVIRRKTLAKRANISEQLWSEIVQTCVEVGLFDKDEYENNTLTSSGIRKRLEKVASEREKARLRKGNSFPAENPRTTPERERERERDIPPLPPSHEGGGSEGRVLLKNEESSGWTLETIPVLDAWREEIGRKPPPALPRVVRQLLRPVEHHEAARLVVDHPGKVFGGFSVEQVVEGVRKLGQSGYRPSPENLIRLTAGLMKPREDGGNVARLMTFDEAAVEARKYGFGDRWQQVFPLVHGSPDGKARWVKPHEAELLPEGYSLAEPHNTDAPKNGTKR